MQESVKRIIDAEESKMGKFLIGFSSFFTFAYIMYESTVAFKDDMKCHLQHNKTALCNYKNKQKNSKKVHIFGF